MFCLREASYRGALRVSYILLSRCVGFSALGSRRPMICSLDFRRYSVLASCLMFCSLGTSEHLLSGRVMCFTLSRSRTCLTRETRPIFCPRNASDVVLLSELLGRCSVLETHWTLFCFQDSSDILFSGRVGSLSVFGTRRPPFGSRNASSLFRFSGGVRDSSPLQICRTLCYYRISSGLIPLSGRVGHYHK